MFILAAAVFPLSQPDVRLYQTLNTEMNMILQLLCRSPYICVAHWTVGSSWPLNVPH